MSSKIHILGGGPAGLALSFYARKSGIPYHLLEANHQVGGNAITYQSGPFSYDSGAHRFHDKDSEVTQDILELMGDDLRRIEVPSEIFSHGRFIHFPLSPYNLAMSLGFKGVLQAFASWVNGRFFHKPDRDSFEAMTRNRYGNYLAKRFLLNYSEKLWGIKPDRLSPEVSGNRLKGLDLKTFVIEAIRGSKAKTTHLDGAFYYPTHGYGRLMEALAGNPQNEAIDINSRITQIHHHDGAVHRVELEGGERIETEQVFSTLPIGMFMQMLSPAAPESLLSLSKKIRFRNLVLVALFIDKRKLTPNASIYFPDPNIPFTRGYEPQNRCPKMAPDDKTSFVVEIPCYEEDEIWQASDEALGDRVTTLLTDTGLFTASQVSGFEVQRMKNAYPVLSQESTEDIKEILKYLSTFKNLVIQGRNGLFEYTHTHDLLRVAKDAVDKLQQEDAPIH